MPRRLELRIEELVLHGFAPGDRYRIAEAMERELTHLLSTQGMSPRFGSDGAVVRMDDGSFEMAPDSRPDTVGVQVAQAIYREMER
jgi:hypothetical protein